MALFRFAEDCEDPAATPAGSLPVFVPDGYAGRVPRPLHRGNRRSHARIFDAPTLAQLERSAQSGSVFESLPAAAPDSARSPGHALPLAPLGLIALAVFLFSR